MLAEKWNLPASRARTPLESGFKGRLSVQVAENLAAEVHRQRLTRLNTLTFTEHEGKSHGQALRDSRERDRGTQELRSRFSNPCKRALREQARRPPGQILRCSFGLSS